KLPAAMIANISGESAVTEFVASEGMQKVGEYLYKSIDPNNPKVGDIRIKFSVVKSRDVSVMGKQHAAKLDTFSTPFGDFSKISMGVHGTESMIASAKKSNTIFTWVLRLFGFMLMFIGMSLVFKPLQVLADVVPFIGSIVAMGTSLLAFLIAISCAFMTVALAWIAYRPLIAVPFLVVSLIGIYNLIKNIKKKKVLNS
ncbi:MAG: TMEM43 family protein, partial [Lentisphaeria bacterium]